MKMLLLFLTSWFLGLEPLHEAGFRGEGITIAVIDGGFYGVDQDSAAYPSEQIIGWKDFLEQDSTFFTDINESHGSMVLSTMLTEKNDDGQALGTAPGANYFLIRTEDIYAEYPGEMNNLAKGIRYADSIGADIITISLGYRQFDNPDDDLKYEDINGKSAVSLAATEAARHGRIVVVAAGNDGNDPWHYIAVPSDADSILCVGAVDEDSIVAPFSSFGPTADGRELPQVSAWGFQSMVYSPAADSCIRKNGTSFAAPRIAGMAACLRQAMPQLSAMDLRRMIIESASNYPNWDPQMGYGIPNAAAIWQAYTALPSLDAHSEEPLYFNLQGIQLDSAPEHGFYIEKRGNTVRKLVRP